MPEAPIDDGPALVRIRYFVNVEGSSEPLPEPTLKDAAAALAQADAYLEAAQLLAGDLQPITPFPIVSIEMGSPLLIFAAIPLIVRYGPPLVGLGEQIATSVPRVIRKRREDKVVGRYLHQVLKEKDPAQTAAIAAGLMRLGPSPPQPPGPSAVDLVREAVDEEVEAGHAVTARNIEALREAAARKPKITIKPAPKPTSQPKPKPKRRLA